jgi:hypothetical protein
MLHTEFIPDGDLETLNDNEFMTGFQLSQKIDSFEGQIQKNRKDRNTLIKQKN